MIMMKFIAMEKDWRKMKTNSEEEMKMVMKIRYQMKKAGNLKNLNQFQRKKKKL